MNTSNAHSEQLANQIDAQTFRRLHRSSGLFIALNFITSAFIPVAVTVYINAGTLKELWSFIFRWAYVGAGILAIVAIFALLYFLSYRFMIRDGDVVIKHGLLFRQTRYIPLHKVHNVTIRRNLLHRWLGVAEMRLESAASGQSSEALLRVLALKDAQAFEQLINHQSAPFSSNDHATDQPTISATVNLLPLNRQELLRLGMMSNQSVLLSIVFAVLTLMNVDISQWLHDHAANWLMVYTLGKFSFLPLLLWAIVGIIVVAALSKLLDILLTFIAYGNFSLTDSEHHITLRRGLFTRIESHVPHQKIQVWRIQQGPLQRLFSRYSLHINTAVLPGQNDGDARGIRHIIPIADEQTMARLIARWTHIQPLTPTFITSFTKQHAKAPRRIAIGYTLQQLIYIALLLATVAFIAFINNRSPLISQSVLIYCLGALIALIPINIFAARKRYRYAGWTIDDRQYLHWRDGSIWQKHHFCQCANIQSLRVGHNFVDRHHRMANLYVDTMGARNAAAAVTSQTSRQTQFNRFRHTPMSLKYIPYEHIQRLVGILRQSV